MPTRFNANSDLFWHLSHSVTVLLAAFFAVSCSLGDSFTKGLLKQDPFVQACEAENGGPVANGFCTEWKDSCSNDGFRTEFASFFLDSPYQLSSVRDPSIVEKVLEDGKLSQEECLNELEAAHILYKDEFEMNLAGYQNSSNAVIQAQLGKIYNIRLKGSESLCLTAEDRTVLWRSCSSDGVDMRQQFHFISRQEIKYQRQSHKAAIEDEAFKLLSLNDAQAYYAQDKSTSSDNFKGLRCIHLGDGATLTYRSCDEASYFMLPPSQFGFNQALTDDQTRGEVSSQESRRYVSLLGFYGSGMNRFIDKNHIEIYKQQFNFQLQTAPDFYSQFEYRIQACSDLKDAIGQELASLSCDKRPGEPLCTYLEGKKSILGSDINGDYQYCDTCDAMRERSFDPYFTETERQKAQKKFAEQCGTFPSDMKPIRLEDYSANFRIFHLGFQGLGQVPSISEISSYEAINQSQEKEKGVQLSVEECEFSPHLRYGLCRQSMPIKKLIDYESSFAGRQVYQLRQKDDRCLRLKDSDKIEVTNCDDRDKNGDTIDQSTHFTREIVDYAEAQDSTRVFLQFRSKKDPSLCVSGDGEAYQAFLCAESEDSDKPIASNASGIFEITSDGMFLGSDRSGQMMAFPCSLVSDDQASEAYDCNYEAPKWISVLKTLGLALLGLLVLALPFASAGSLVLGLAMLVFSIPSYVVEGVLCTQNASKSAKLGGCMGIAMGVPIDLITFGVFDAGRFASKFLYKAGKVAEKTPVLKQVGRSWHISRTIKLLKNSKSFGAENIGDVSADRAFKLKFIRFVADKKLKRKHLDEIFKAVTSDKYRGKLCGKVDCTHPALKSSDWVTSEGRNRFIDSLKEEAELYLKNMEAKPNPELTRWERLWNKVMWNTESKNETTIDIMRAVVTMLDKNASDEALQKAYVILRNRNIDHIQTDL